MKTPLAALSEEVRRLTGTCSRCGECLAVCPTYLVSGDESLSTRGRLQLIRAALEGKPAVPRRLGEQLAACLGCMACNTVCPAAADPAAIISAVRAAAPQSPSGRRIKASAAARAMSACAGMAPVPQAVALKIAAAVKLAPLPGETRVAPPAQVTREGLHLWKAARATPSTPAAGAGMPAAAAPTVLLFPGCATGLLFPQTVRAAIKVLNHWGYQVVMTPRQECCGYSYRSLGETARAAGQYSRMLAALKGIAADAVVTLCPSCALGLKRPPGGLPPELRSEAEALASRSFEIHELLSPVRSHPDDRLPNPPQPLNSPTLQETVLWHDPCHLRFGLGIYDEPRLLLRLTGVEPVESGRQSCCGSAGLFALTHPELSASIGRRLAGETAGASAGLIATACPSCRMRLVDLSGNLAAGRAPAGVVHTVELLASKICLGEMNSEVSPDKKIINYR